MAIIQGFTASFKEELAKGTHDFVNDTFKMALYTSSASLGSSTAAYTVAEETSGIGYTAGGVALTFDSITTSGDTAYIDFDDATWAGATFSAAGALIYNSSKSNKTVMVLSFGTTRSVVADTFIVQFPAATSTTAIIRIRS